jgi:hypothetical protein
MPATRKTVGSPSNLNIIPFYLVFNTEDLGRKE